jgi:hypothetical protein
MKLIWALCRRSSSPRLRANLPIMRAIMCNKRTRSQDTTLMFAIALSLALNQPLIFTFSGCPNNNNTLDVAQPVGATHFTTQTLIYLNKILDAKANLFVASAFLPFLFNCYRTDQHNNGNLPPIPDIVSALHNPPPLTQPKGNPTSQPNAKSCVITIPNKPPPITPPSGYPTGQPSTK